MKATQLSSFDEADTFLGRNSAMRGILNCGNTRRTAYVLRLATSRSRAANTENDPEFGGGRAVVRYKAWCPELPP